IDADGIASGGEVPADDAEPLAVMEIGEGAVLGKVAHGLRRQRRAQRCEETGGEGQPSHAGTPARRRSRPVISAGWSTPSMPRIVGPTSQSAPPSRSGTTSPLATCRNGTGFVVCAVCGPPVAGSIIISQFPWSAV